jgi:hypothetical protein
MSLLFEKINLLLSKKRFLLTNEKLLQVQLNEIFEKAKASGNFPEFTREHHFNKKDIVDFFANGAAIEIKIKGGPMSIYRQLDRYAAHENVTEIILITNKAMTLPALINGKPANLVNLSLAWL